MEASGWRSYEFRPVTITGQQVAETARFISRYWCDCDAKVFLPGPVGFVRKLWFAIVQRHAWSLTTISPNTKSGKNQHEGHPI
jgi:hypothetical protein